MSDTSTRRFWMSFVDDDRPEGQRFLGACIVEVSFEEAAAELPGLHRDFPNHRPGAEWIAAAARKAWRLGINPGGEVATFDLTDYPAPPSADVVLDVLMDRDELHRRGLV